MHEERIRELDEMWAKAAERRDLDGMMAIYADDAQELLPDLRALVGVDEIRSFYARLIRDHPRFRHEMSPDEITVAASGDLAVVRGRYSFTPDDGAPGAKHEGKFVGVWTRSGGDWLLKYNISNEDPAS